MFLEQTQIRVVCPKSQKQKLSSYLSSVFLKHSEQVRNLGIILDNDLSFDNHINKVTLTKNISKVRKFPSQAESEKLVHVFTSGRLDYCNAIFFFFFLPLRSLDLDFLTESDLSMLKVGPVIVALFFGTSYLLI